MPFSHWTEEWESARGEQGVGVGGGGAINASILSALSH